eukprot:COSAG01_NODE_2234_length_8097_cov_5.001500_2_plen_219_part_00
MASTVPQSPPFVSLTTCWGCRRAGTARRGTPPSSAGSRPSEPPRGRRPPRSREPRPLCERWPSAVVNPQAERHRYACGAVTTIATLTGVAAEHLVQPHPSPRAQDVRSQRLPCHASQPAGGRAAAAHTYQSPTLMARGCGGGRRGGGPLLVRMAEIGRGLLHVSSGPRSCTRTRINSQDVPRGRPTRAHGGGWGVTALGGGWQGVGGAARKHQPVRRA